MDIGSTNYPGWEGRQSGGAQVIPGEARSLPQVGEKAGSFPGKIAAQQS